WARRSSTTRRTPLSCARATPPWWRRSRRAPSAPRLQPEALEVRAEGVGQVRPGQRELDGGLEEAELVAGVVALALELHRVHRPARAQRAQAVGQLDLAAAVGGGLGQDVEEVGRQHVAADDGQV